MAIEGGDPAAKDWHAEVIEARARRSRRRASRSPKGASSAPSAEDRFAITSASGEDSPKKPGRNGASTEVGSDLSQKNGEEQAETPKGQDNVGTPSAAAGITSALELAAAADEVEERRVKRAMRKLKTRLLQATAVVQEQRRNVYGFPDFTLRNKVGEWPKWRDYRTDRGLGRTAYVERPESSPPFPALPLPAPPSPRLRKEGTAEVEADAETPKA
jgi:hypothetical protein